MLPGKVTRSRSGELVSLSVKCPSRKRFVFHSRQELIKTFQVYLWIRAKPVILTSSLSSVHIEGELQIVTLMFLDFRIEVGHPNPYIQTANNGQYQDSYPLRCL